MPERILITDSWSAGRWFARGRPRPVAGVLGVILACALTTTEARAASEPNALVNSTAAERWAMARVCAGDVADLAGISDSPTGRRLGAAFLADLVFGRLCDLPPRGVHIVNAWFTEPIDLQGTNIAVQFRLRHSRFDAPVSLERVRADKVLSFAGSHFAQPLVMNEIDVRGSMFLGGGATYAAPVLLQGAHIGGQAVFGSDSLDRPNVAIKPSSGPPAAEPVQPEAPTRFAAPVDMADIRIDGSLDLGGIIAESEVSLDRARIDGDLRLTGGRFCADLNMGTIRVGELLAAWGIAWPGRPDCPNGAAAGGAANAGQPATGWNLYNSDIRGNLFLSGADLTHLGLLNLSGTRIGGQLFLGSIDHMPPNTWGDRSVLMLRNVAVGKIQDLGGLYTNRPVTNRPELPPEGEPQNGAKRQSWAPLLVLDGFTYGAWDGLGREERSYGDERRIVQARDDAWLIAWLARDRSYTRQPYEQLAAVMQAQGRRDSRDAILFTSRDIERCIAAGSDTGHDIEACVLRKSDLAGRPATVPVAQSEAWTGVDGAAHPESPWDGRETAPC